MQQNIRVVHATQIAIESPSVIIKGALTVTETFNVQNTGGVSAPATITGSANFAGDVVAGGISVMGHVHTDVQPGSVVSGLPQG